MSDKPANDSKDKESAVNGDAKKPEVETEKPVEPVLTVEDGLSPGCVLSPKG